MDINAEQTPTLFQRFMRVVPTEILRRFIEYIVITVVFSLLMKLLDNSGVSEDNASLYRLAKILIFVVFYVVNILCCKRSSYRMHKYYSRYYAANIISYILYVLVTLLFIGIFGAMRYLTFFGITVILAFEQVISLSYLYQSIVIFHLITLAIIAISPKGGISRMIYLINLKKGMFDDSYIIE